METNIFWLCVGALCVFVITQMVKKCKKVTVTNEANDPDEEEIKMFLSSSTFVFRDHFGYLIVDEKGIIKEFTEKEAINFSNENPSFEVSIYLDKKVYQWEPPYNYWNLKKQ